MNEKVVEHVQQLRYKMNTPREHKHILADMFLEDDILCHVQEIRWDTYPRHKVTLTIEVFP